MPGKRPIRIAIDCMGGDFAPQEIVKGAIQGARKYQVGLQLVGLRDKVEAELAGLETDGIDFEVVHASEVIEMGESPATAIRKKKDASVVVASTCVAKGESQGIIAAGSTGAAMAAALFNMGRIEGVDRPAIAVVLPSSQEPPCLLVDAGANADCIPEMLVQFAKMGTIFSQAVINVPNPRVGLLNIGEESSKGNSFSLSTYKMLEQHDEINFIGNIESRHLFDGSADFVVCDGFTGNVVIKTAEGVGRMVMQCFKKESSKSLRARAGALLVRSTMKKVKSKVSDEEFGGALLLGVKGICVIGHGGSNANAIENAVRVAKNAIQQDVIGKIEEKVKEGVLN
jgi:phosphate acyltransferase